MKQGVLLRDLKLVLDRLAGLVGLALLEVLGLPLARFSCVKEIKYNNIIIIKEYNIIILLLLQ